MPESPSKPKVTQVPEAPPRESTLDYLPGAQAVRTWGPTATLPLIGSGNPVLRAMGMASAGKGALDSGRSVFSRGESREGPLHSGVRRTVEAVNTAGMGAMVASGMGVTKPVVGAMARMAGRTGARALAAGTAAEGAVGTLSGPWAMLPYAGWVSGGAINSAREAGLPERIYSENRNAMVSDSPEEYNQLWQSQPQYHDYLMSAIATRDASAQGVGRNSLVFDKGLWYLRNPDTNTNLPIMDAQGKPNPRVQDWARGVHGDSLPDNTSVGGRLFWGLQNRRRIGHSTDPLNGGSRAEITRNLAAGAGMVRPGEGFGDRYPQWQTQEWRTGWESRNPEAGKYLAAAEAANPDVRILWGPEGTSPHVVTPGTVSPVPLYAQTDDGRSVRNATAWRMLLPQGSGPSSEFGPGGRLPGSASVSRMPEYEADQEPRAREYAAQEARDRAIVAAAFGSAAQRLTPARLSGLASQLRTMWPDADANVAHRQRTQQTPAPMGKTSSGVPVPRQLSRVDPLLWARVGAILDRQSQEDRP